MKTYFLLITKNYCDKKNRMIFMIPVSVFTTVFAKVSNFSIGKRVKVEFLCELNCSIAFVKKCFAKNWAESSILYFFTLIPRAGLIFLHHQ